MTPQFSIITVTRDNLTGLQDTGASIAQQCHVDFEWIVVDAASVDGTPEHLAACKYPWLRWTSEPDGGIYDGMNRGIARARGSYLWFLNAGDTLAEAGTLQRVSSVVKEGPAPDFVFGDALERSADGVVRERPARDTAYVTRGMFTHHQAMVFRRAWVGDRRYDTEYRLSADYDLVARLLRDDDPDIKRVHAALCIFELGGQSHTHRRAAIAEDAQIRLALGVNPAAVRALWLGHHVHRLAKRWFPQWTAQRRAGVR